MRRPVKSPAQLAKEADDKRVAAGGALPQIVKANELGATTMANTKATLSGKRRGRRSLLDGINATNLQSTLG